MLIGKIKEHQLCLPRDKDGPENLLLTAVSQSAGGLWLSDMRVERERKGNAV